MDNGNAEERAEALLTGEGIEHPVFEFDEPIAEALANILFQLVLGGLDHPLVFVQGHLLLVGARPFGIVLQPSAPLAPEYGQHPLGIIHHQAAGVLEVLHHLGVVQAIRRRCSGSAVSGVSHVFSSGRFRDRHCYCPHRQIIRDPVSYLPWIALASGRYRLRRKSVLGLAQAPRKRLPISIGRDLPMCHSVRHLSHFSGRWPQGGARGMSRRAKGGKKARSRPGERASSQINGGNPSDSGGGTLRVPGLPGEARQGAFRSPILCDSACVFKYGRFRPPDHRFGDFVFQAMIRTPRTSVYGFIPLFCPPLAEPRPNPKRIEDERGAVCCGLRHNQ